MRVCFRMHEYDGTAIQVSPLIMASIIIFLRLYTKTLTVLHCAPSLQSGSTDLCAQDRAF